MRGLRRCRQRRRRGDLEIEAAAARLHRTEMIQTVPPATGPGGGSGKKEDEKDVLPPSTSGDIAKWTTPNGNARQAAYNAISAAPLGRSSVGIDKDVEKRRKVILSSLVERLEVSPTRPPRQPCHHGLRARTCSRAPQGLPWSYGRLTPNG